MNKLVQIYRESRQSKELEQFLRNLKVRGIRHRKTQNHVTTIQRLLVQTFITVMAQIENFIWYSARCILSYILASIGIQTVKIVGHKMLRSI